MIFFCFDFCSNSISMSFKSLNSSSLISSFDIFINFFVNFLRWRLSSRFSRFSRFRISIDDVIFFFQIFHEFFFRVFFRVFSRIFSRISRTFFVSFLCRVCWLDAILIKTIVFCLIQILIIIISIFTCSNCERFRLINLTIFFYFSSSPFSCFWIREIFLWLWFFWIWRNSLNRSNSRFHQNQIKKQLNQCDRRKQNYRRRACRNQIRTHDLTSTHKRICERKNYHRSCFRNFHRKILIFLNFQWKYTFFNRNFSIFSFVVKIIWIVWTHWIFIVFLKISTHDKSFFRSR